MKKTSILLLIIMFLFCGCINDSEWKVGESMSKINKEYVPYISMGTLSGYENKNNYWIVINNGDNIEKLVVFSPERKSLQIQNLNLIECEDIHRFLGMNITQLEEIYGSPHADIGSGFYIPAYITNDACLICLELESDVVIDVIKRDLLTNDIIECAGKY